MERHYKIIEELAYDRFVETTVSHVARYSHRSRRDLSQDIYLDLLLKPADLIEGLYDRGELKYFITRIIINNLYSKTSPYYFIYNKWNEMKNPITENIINKADE